MNKLTFYRSILLIVTLKTKLVKGDSMQCPGFEAEENTNNDSPQLQFSMIKSTMNNLSIFRETENVILINRTKVFNVHLDCWASYPIDLTFKGHVTNQHSEVKTKVNSYTRNDGIKGHCYHINVSMGTYEEITGNYSCFAISNSRKRNSKYIYVYSTPPGVLLRRGQNVTLNLEPGEKSIVLPCAVSNPEVQVRLRNLTGNNWVVVPSESVKFDPKQGFIMNITNAYDFRLGEYRCETAIGQMDVLNIRIVAPKDWVAKPNVKNVILLKRGDRLILSCKAQDEIFIDLNPKLPQETTEKEMNFSRKTSHYKFVSKVYTKVLDDPVVSGSAKCIRKSDNITLHAWQFTVTNDSRKNGELDTSFITSSCPNPRITKQSTLVLYECNNWIECGISQCIGQDSACQPNVKCSNSIWRCLPQGIIQCPTAIGVISQIYFTGFNGTKYTNRKYAPTDEILRLRMDESKTNLTSKDPINLMCEGTNFVFAAGFQWYLVFKNGSMMDLMQYSFFANKSSIRETWGHSKSTIVSTLSFPIEFGTNLSADSTIQSIICSAPVWNSTEWMNQTMGMEMPFKILDKLNARSQLDIVNTINSSASSKFIQSFVSLIFFVVSYVA